MRVILLPVLGNFITVVLTIAALHAQAPIPAEERIQKLYESQDLAGLASYASQLVAFARDQAGAMAEQVVLIDKLEQQRETYLSNLSQLAGQIQDQQRVFWEALDRLKTQAADSAAQTARLEEALRIEREERRGMMATITNLDRYGARQQVEAIAGGLTAGAAIGQNAQSAAIGAGANYFLQWILRRKP